MKNLPLFHNSAIDRANAQQRLASNPEASVFVSASAGSGKTKLLVDRLLRLMLPRIDGEGKLQPGTHPHRIQCLTYSRAAAAEMAIRLQRRLGEWVGFTNEELDRSLIELEITPTPEIRKAARALFAEVLDLPGGMRIETNHAFCQSILKRFPVEAAVVPQFKIIEESDNFQALQRAIEQGIPDVTDEKIKALSEQISIDNFFQVLKELLSHKRQFNALIPLIEQGKIDHIIAEIFGIPYLNEDQLIQPVCEHWPDEEAYFSFLKESLEIVEQEKSVKQIQNCLTQAIRWLSLPVSQRRAQWDRWCSCYLTAKGTILNFLSTDGKTEALKKIKAKLYKNAERLCRIEHQRIVSRTARISLCLLQAAVPILKNYQESKKHQGVVDYNDLISHTLDLLDDPGAAWILYKLDGGLDHILLDEVQDNSGEQWRIASDLSAEFFAGLGIESNAPRPRTIFAVGDFKQSIYSFQGADPAQFDRWRQRFREKVLAAHQIWQEPQLTVSFRSTEPILDFVDHVFTSENSSSGLSEGGQDKVALKHESSKLGEGGRVELWPLVIEQTEKTDDDNLWEVLDENIQQQSADQQLANELASWINKQIGKVPPYGGKPIMAGDILILVTKRSAFVFNLIRALKSRKIPVATLVRTNLTDQLAVKDLLALCDVLLLPQDDLTLACVLKSPLGGLTEDDLMELAGRRQEDQPLWSALRSRYYENERWDRAWKMLYTLFNRIDYVSPYELLSEILGEHGGRAKIMARLGGESLEAIDELLSAAQQYETNHTASVQGFLHWLRSSERIIKHEAESTFDMVRIMTVHGAKGLQGRLVILPDTVNPAGDRRKGNKNDRLFWTKDPSSDLEIPLYVPRKELQTPLTIDLQKRLYQAEIEERNRLLYVALTRASEWLVICGWYKPKSNSKEKETDEAVNFPEDVWYQYCRNAIQAMSALPKYKFEHHPFKWEGELLVVEKQSSFKPEKVASKGSITLKTPDEIILPSWMGKEPDWIGVPPPEEAENLTSLIPSRPDGVYLGKVPSVHSPLQATGKKVPFFRGRLVHELLQYLPDCPKEEREAIALQWIERTNMHMKSQDAKVLIKQVLSVMEHSDLHFLFDSESLVEQPLIGVVDGIVITGKIDRMRILPEQVIICDFKSGRRAPKIAENIPEIYLKQMAAYRSLIREIYPNRLVNALLVWTDDAKITKIPEILLEKYYPTRGENHIDHIQ